MLKVLVVVLMVWAFLDSQESETPVASGVLWATSLAIIINLWAKP